MQTKTIVTFILILMLIHIYDAQCQNSDKNNSIISSVENSMSGFLNDIPDDILINYGIKC